MSPCIKMTTSGKARARCFTRTGIGTNGATFIKITTIPLKIVKT